MSLKDLSNYTIYSRYAHYIPELKRRETWDEIVERVFGMHERKYAEQLASNEEFKKEFLFAKDMVRKKKVLGSQRALQFGGKWIEKENLKIFNCFSVETEFITSEGVKSFTEFNDGDKIKTLSHNGLWKDATVRMYGQQDLNLVTVAYGNSSKDFFVTPNHRWIKRDGTETTDLKVGDYLMSSLDIFSQFNYENANPFEKLYWCYGYVFGDGTKIKNKNGEYVASMVRLCKHQIKYHDRFKEMGFSSSEPLSCGGDIMCYTGSYLKIAPNPQIDTPEMIRAFVAGYLAADGENNSNFNNINAKYNSENQFTSILASDEEHINFIKKCFPIAGVFIISEKDISGQETNFGVRKLAKIFRIRNVFDRKSNYLHPFRVVSIKNNVKREQVWCLEVDEDKSFTFPNGLITGNCSFTHIDRVNAFSEIFYALLCGVGIGYSVQFHHIKNLPSIAIPIKSEKVYVLDDSIEGWSDALAVLLSSYFITNQKFPEYFGYNIKFDFSKIRPEGALIAGQFLAPGPNGLKAGLEKVRNLLNKVASKTDSSLAPIDCYDIICFISDTVLSGGIRRAASLCLFSKDDQEMMKSKTGDWYIKNPQRARSNNSVILERDKVSKEEFNIIYQNIKEYGEPAFYFTSDLEVGPNPCQPSSAIVLTPQGLSTFGQIKEGDKIWSESGWVTVIKKWSTGVKKVYKYQTTAGSFLGTENHRLISNGIKIEAKDCDSIDILRGPYSSDIIINPQDVMDGLFIGDGMYHKASNNLKLLCIGEKDQDYLDSEVKDLIGRHRDGISSYTWEINTTIDINELPKTYDRYIPDRFYFGDKNKVAGFLRGLFSANGSMAGGRVTLKAASFRIIEQAQTMLSSLGIKSYFTTNKPSTIQFSNGIYTNKQSYDLNITLDRNKFYSIIGFIQKYKTEELEKHLDKKQLKPEKISYDIISNDFISEEEVFDITVDNEQHTYWTNSVNVSNCVEIGMYPKTTDGRSGIQGCNLTEINGKYCISEQSFYDSCRAASILGTLQAGYTKFNYLSKETKEIFEKEALLGVSLTGWMENPDILFKEIVLKQGAEIVKETNRKVAKMIGINPAARTCCVKPAGSTSCILETSSGIHPHHAKRYIRNVQANKNEFAVKYYKQVNPVAVEESVWSSNKTDDVISFCCEVPKGSILKNNINAIDFLNKIQFVQQNWVRTGNDKTLSLKDCDHNVSCTVVVKNDEWERVRDFIFQNREFFTGISLISSSGDLDYRQAPFTTVLTDKEIVEKYGNGSLLASGLIVDGIQAFNGDLYSACESVLGVVELPKQNEVGEEPKKPSRKDYKSEKQYSSALVDYSIQLNIFFQNKGEYEDLEQKYDWVRRAKQFAERYFAGDIKLMTYCLKHVDIWKRYLDINREHKEIDWSKVIENKQEMVAADSLAAQSCSGGACLLTI